MLTQDAQIFLQGISVSDLIEKLQQVRTVEKSDHPIDENLTIEEAAKFLKLSVPTIWRLKAVNKIPFTKIGSRVIFRRLLLNAWMDEKTNGPKVHTR